MSSSSSSTSSLPIIKYGSFLVFFFFLLACSTLVSSNASDNTFHPRKELLKLRRIKAQLRRLNKPPIKTIRSGENGDVIDCVLAHLQPAFDHPLLKGQKPMDPPQGVLNYKGSLRINESFRQAWTDNGGSCPQGSVPIRRTREEDLLRASSVRRYGRKPSVLRLHRRDISSSTGHDHAVGYVTGGSYYGAKASMNVWKPKVANPSTEFSLSQIWIIAGSFGSDLNTIESGWQVSPQLYGDSNPRFFTYWTTDAYQATGCYNLLCSGFIQTSNQVAVGAAISPTSTFGGPQFDITLVIWKDPRHGHWWLQLGSHLVGYWPELLFSHLSRKATMVQFGGEVVNPGTEMGSGSLPSEGFGKAAYFRNVEVVDDDNSLVSAAGLRLLADHPGCYDVRGGRNINGWGQYFYYGGPGNDPTKCH